MWVRSLELLVNVVTLWFPLNSVCPISCKRLVITILANHLWVLDMDKPRVSPSNCLYCIIHVITGLYVNYYCHKYWLDNSITVQLQDGFVLNLLIAKFMCFCLQANSKVSTLYIGSFQTWCDMFSVNLFCMFTYLWLHSDLTAFVSMNWLIKIKLKWSETVQI